MSSSVLRSSSSRGSSGLLERNSGGFSSTFRRFTGGCSSIDVFSSMGTNIWVLIRVTSLTLSIGLNLSLKSGTWAVNGVEYCSGRWCDTASCCFSRWAICVQRRWTALGTEEAGGASGGWGEGVGGFFKSRGSVLFSYSSFSVHGVIRSYSQAIRVNSISRKSGKLSQSRTRRTETEMTV